MSSGGERLCAGCADTYYRSQSSGGDKVPRDTAQCREEGRLGYSSGPVGSGEGRVEGRQGYSSFSEW